MLKALYLLNRSFLYHHCNVENITLLFWYWTFGVSYLLSPFVYSVFPTSEGRFLHGFTAFFSAIRDVNVKPGTYFLTFTYFVGIPYLIKT